MFACICAFHVVFNSGKNDVRLSTAYFGITFKRKHLKGRYFHFINYKVREKNIHRNVRNV